MTADATMIEDLAPQWIGIEIGLMTIDHRIDAIVLDEVEAGNKALNHSIHALHDALNKLFCTVNFVMHATRKDTLQEPVGYSYLDSVSKSL